MDADGVVAAGTGVATNDLLLLPLGLLENATGTASGTGVVTCVLLVLLPLETAAGPTAGAAGAAADDAAAAAVAA